MNRNPQGLAKKLAFYIFVSTSMLSSGHAFAQQSPTRAELESLREQARQAREDASEALKRAKRSEEAIAKLLANLPPAPGPSTTPTDIAGAADCGGDQKAVMQRMDCFHPKPEDPRPIAPANRLTKQQIEDYRIATKGLVAYAVNHDAEIATADQVNETGASPAGGKNKTPQVNFNRIDSPVTSRIGVAKGEQSFDMAYALPLSRRRAIVFDGQGVYSQTINTNMTFGFSASFDKNNESKTGLIRRDGIFGDDPIKVTIGFARQYFRKRPLYGEDNSSVSQLARKYAGKMIAQCKADLGKMTDQFGFKQPGPDGCSGDALLDWTFNPKNAAFKDNMAAYNETFWGQPKDAIPEHGYGLSAGISRQNFKYLLPATFAPGIIIGGSNPTLLSTLLFKDKDGVKPDLNGQADLRYSYELRANAFHYWEAPIPSFLTGMMVRSSLTIARRSLIGKDFKDVEFCGIKATTVPGASNRECKKFNIAAPEAAWSFEPELNARFLFAPGGTSLAMGRFAPSIGVSPTIGFSTQTDRYRASVPIFLGANDKDQLNGGIQWSHEWGDGKPSESVWSVFLSTPFTLDGSK